MELSIPFGANIVAQSMNLTGHRSSLTIIENSNGTKGIAFDIQRANGIPTHNILRQFGFVFFLLGVAAKVGEETKTIFAISIYIRQKGIFRRACLIAVQLDLF